ncbi:hypothetical protein EOPP23_05805 [Endozoicomonas sp. OPT23]|uniref:hypothetical protein n=1 Tax=Endozoicomonas sp. OPT23 TaxID=2072845 RepID=UPI00129B415A|nr:hypothetical protein [Endozoicomonas sp. OPT23]MRI32499.1 hypothetical protein [Endozoicomonas sp. OPT23]
MKILNTLFPMFFLSLLQLSHADVVLKNQPKEKSEYLNTKCINGTKAINSTSAKITYNELCLYGEIGCPDSFFKGKIKAYCKHNELSKCFNKKGWMTINQLIGIPDKVKLGLITYGLGKKTSLTYGKTCAYWD